MGQLHELPLSMVHPNPDQPRQTFDDGSLEELAASLKAYGQLQPIAVRPVADGYIIIAGERRWRAAQLAGWTEISAVVRDNLTEEQAFELSLMENVVREDMNPVEEAGAYQRLLDIGIPEGDICERFGWMKGTVTWKVQVLGCREDIRHLVARRQLTLIQGIQLGRLSYNGQAKALRVLTSERLDQVAFTQLVNAIHAQESSVEMFAAEEVELTPEAQKAGKVATDFLRLAGAAAGQLSDHDDLQIGSGLTGEVGVEEKVEVIMRALHRLRNIARRRRGQLLAGQAERQSHLDSCSPANYNLSTLKGQRQEA